MAAPRNLAANVEVIHVEKQFSNSPIRDLSINVVFRTYTGHAPTTNNCFIFISRIGELENYLECYLNFIEFQNIWQAKYPMQAYSLRGKHQFYNSQ